MIRNLTADYQFVPGAKAATGATAAAVLPFTDLDTLIAKFVVSAATGTSPTLDLYLQVLGPDGNWYDMVHFAQQTTATTAGSAIWAAVSTADSTRYAGVVGSKTIGAGTVGVGILSNQFRLAYTIGGTNPSFTFTVDLYASNENHGGV